MIRPFELRGEARLALVLLTAALLVSIGRDSGLMPHIVDDLDLSAFAMGFAVIAGRLGGSRSSELPSWLTALGRIQSCRSAPS